MLSRYIGLKPEICQRRKNAYREHFNADSNMKLYVRVDVLEKLTLQRADGVCVRFLDEHRVLIDQPRRANHIRSRVLHLHVE